MAYSSKTREHRSRWRMIIAVELRRLPLSLNSFGYVQEGVVGLGDECLGGGGGLRREERAGEEGGWGLTE
ncbi:unnamed protein product [Ilex paraguariensis]|uniref:Uncharacterized protein n=1 Tax=Ilex paraguariensis TaxID=185542 RepID=A0ABC8S3Z3_9AQUA